MFNSSSSDQDYTLQIRCRYDTYILFTDLYVKVKRVKKYKNREQLFVDMINLYANALVMEQK